MVTMYNVLGSLKDHKSIFNTSGSLLVGGDAKMYFHITSLASTYPEEIQELCAFPRRLAYPEELPACPHEGIL